MSVRAIACFTYRHRRKLLASLALSLAVGAGAASQTPARWRAEATVMVDTGRADGAGALSALLHSRDLHARVLEQWGGRLYPAAPAETRADLFARDLGVAAADGAGVVRLSLVAADGDAAVAALSALLDRLAEKNRTVFAAPAASAHAAQAREAVAMMRKRAELDGETQAAEAEAQVTAQRLAALKERLAATPATIEISSESERSKVAENARAKLFELEAREAEMLGKYQDDSVFIHNLRAEKRKVQDMLARLDTAATARVISGANPIRQDLEREAARLDGVLTAAKARARNAQIRLAELTRRLDQLSLPDRDPAVLEQLASQTAIPSPNAAVGGIGIIQTATAGHRPVGPAPAWVMAAAAAIGAGLGLAWAGLAQAFPSRLSSPADVERRLGLPVLTSIPRES